MYTILESLNILSINIVSFLKVNLEQKAVYNIQTKIKFKGTFYNI